MIELVYENEWNDEQYANLMHKLEMLKDKKYKEFNDRMIKTEFVTIGVRTPELKLIAKQIAKSSKALNFLQYAKNVVRSYDEIIIYACVVGSSKISFLDKIEYIDFLSEIMDSWAICDLFVADLKFQKDEEQDCINLVERYLQTDDDWKKRIALVILLGKFVNEKYLHYIFDVCDNVVSDFYYVKMAKAWLIATCMSKFEKLTIEYLKISKLDDWTYNKSIQKAIESRRVDSQVKTVIKTMKR